MEPGETPHPVGAAPVATAAAVVPVRPSEVLRRGLSRGGTQWLLIGSMVAGISAYLFQIVGTRALGDDAFAPIGVLLTIQYLLVSVVLYPVETWVTMSMTATGATASVARVAAWIGASALLTAAAAYAFRDALFPGRGDLVQVAVAIAVAYGGYVWARGWFAGAGRFRAYGLVTASEAVVRLLLAVTVALTASTTLSFAWTLPAGAAVAVAWWWIDRWRGGISRSEDAHPPATGGRSAVGFLAINTAANGAAQLLLAGGPLVLVALNSEPAQISAFFVTISAARAPVLLVLGGVLSRLLPTFSRIAAVDAGGAMRQVALRIAAGTAALAILGGVLGALVGDVLIAVLFGADFRPPRLVVGMVAFALLMATGALILNQALIAANREQALLLPWGAALLVAAAVVVGSDMSDLARVSLGLALGEATALLGLILALRTCLPRPR